MDITGGCYCGALRYVATADKTFAGQCHCRECQYFSGGNPNVIVGFESDTFSYSQGEPKVFARDDLETPAHREFCGECGTHILTRPASNPGIVIVKVGTLDEPSIFEAQFAIQTADSQAFHTIPEGVPSFERWMN